ncbi:Glycosyl transferase [Chitinispirillum alkaliphilum]|nr:Glycosyl transferase [Chitinispirillum alkaliphilum]
MLNKPEILFIATACPFETSGAGKRTIQTAKALANIGKLKIVFATDRKWSKTQIKKTKEAFHNAEMIWFSSLPILNCKERILKTVNPRFLNTHGIISTFEDGKRIKELIKNSDVIWIHTLKPANAFRIYNWPRTIIDIDDFPSGFNANIAQFAKSRKEQFRRKFNSVIWSRHEALWKERFNCMCVCKDSDKAHFGNSDRVFVVPNGLEEVKSFKSDCIKSNTKRIGMIGDFKYIANLDGINWFLKNAWPFLKKKHPNIRLRLIGNHSFEFSKQTGDHAIEGLGYIEDLTPELLTWLIMIAPTRIGGGTSLKVVEGLSYGLPIVATSHGFRGLPIINGENGLIANTGIRFAEACSILISDLTLWNSISMAGLKLFQEKYSLEAVEKCISRAVETCMSLSF